MITFNLIYLNILANTKLLFRQFEIALRKLTILVIGIAFTVPLLLTGCGGGGGTTAATAATATLTSIAITPATPTTPKGVPVTFTATGTYSDGSTSNISSSAIWASNNTTVAIVNSSGISSPLAAGSSTITASANGVTSNSATLTVTDPASPTNVFAVSGTNQVALTWMPVSGASSYNLYWGTAPGITTSSFKITGVPSGYVHTGLTAGSTYYYRIGATDGVNESLSSEVFSFVYTGGVPIGTFSSLVNTTTSRIYGTSTLLPNGQVLLAGGYNVVSGTPVYLSSAELYDPVAGTFTATGAMSVTRQQHTATLLPNGKVLVAGGYDEFGNSRSTAEVYDPAAGLFTPTANNMSTVRRLAASLLLNNGKVLIAGGAINYVSGSPGVNTSSADLYDPATNSFAATGSTLETRSYASLILLPNGKALIFGGYGASSAPTATAEVYDPAAGTFSATGAMTTARVYSYSTLLPNGKVLVAGGLLGTTTTLASAELYDPATGSFAFTGPLNHARHLHAGSLLSNGTVLVAGGYDLATGYVSSAEIYNPATAVFTDTGSLTTGRYAHRMTTLPNGKVLVVSGLTTGGVYSNTAEVFNP